MKLEGFIGPSYVLAHPSASAQRLVNLYPEVMEAGPRKGNVMRFVGTPGTRLFATLGNGPIRGVHRATTGQLFAVSGNALYEVTSHGDVLLRSGTLNSASGRVTIADDGTRLIIGDGAAIAYQANLTTGASLAAVADGDCPGGQVAWQDGYFIHTVPGTGQFAISGLNDVTYDATDVATAEGRPDNLVMLLSVNRELWLFGEATTEVWWNSGNAAFPFERRSDAFIETGTVAPGTCVRAGGSAAWVGSDERGRGTVWHAQGLSPVRISTHAVEHFLANSSRLPESSAFAYQQGGHEFYVLTVPGNDEETGGTWAYDFSTGLWHERMYLSASDSEEPHRAWVGTVAFGEVIVGDREDGRLYVLDPTYYLDDGDPIRRIRQTPHISQEEKRIRYKSFELQAEPGVGLVSGQGSAPVVLLSWSDDGGHTWSNEHEASLGAMGKYKNRAKWRRLGAGRDRVFRVAMSDPVPVTWLGAEIDAEQLER
jgi:hypothetical protein